GRAGIGDALDVEREGAGFGFVEAIDDDGEALAGVELADDLGLELAGARIALQQGTAADRAIFDGDDGVEGRREGAKAVQAGLLGGESKGAFAAFASPTRSAKRIGNTLVGEVGGK